MRPTSSSAPPLWDRGLLGVAGIGVGGPGPGPRGRRDVSRRRPRRRREGRPEEASQGAPARALRPGGRAQGRLPTIPCGPRQPPRTRRPRPVAPGRAPPRVPPATVAQARDLGPARLAAALAATPGRGRRGPVATARARRRGGASQRAWGATGRGGQAEALGPRPSPGRTKPCRRGGGRKPSRRPGVSRAEDEASVIESSGARRCLARVHASVRDARGGAHRMRSVGG